MATCPRCDGAGAVTVNYESGELRDLGICGCPAAWSWRQIYAADPALLKARYGDQVDRIRLLEELLDGGVAAQPRAGDDDLLINAGKVIKAGLGGKVIR